METLLVNKLNRRITIQEKTTTTDPEGVSIETWVDVVTVWANRASMVTGGREFFQAAAINAEKMVKYIIRYRKNILPNMRIVDLQDNMVYNIRTVMDDYLGDKTQTHLIADVIQDG